MSTEELARLFLAGMERGNPIRHDGDALDRLEKRLFSKGRLYETLRFLLERALPIPIYDSACPFARYLPSDFDAQHQPEACPPDAHNRLQVGLLAAQAVQQLRRLQPVQEPLRAALQVLEVPSASWVGALAVAAANPWVDLLQMLPESLHAYAPTVAQLVEILTLIDPLIPNPEWLPAVARAVVSCPFPLVSGHTAAVPALLTRFVAEVGVPARVLGTDKLPYPLVYPHPELLLHSSFAQDFRESVQNAFEYALRATGMQSACIRWHLQAFFSEEPPRGFISGPSVGVAAALAMRRLLEGGGSLDDREAFSGGVAPQGGVLPIGALRFKTGLLSTYRDLYLNVWTGNEASAPPDWRGAGRVRTFVSLDRAYQRATGLTAELQNYLSRLQDDLNRIDWANLTLERVFVDPHLQIRKPAPQPERPTLQTPTERSERARQEFPTSSPFEEAQAQLYELLPHGDRYITEPVRWQRFCTEALKPNAHTALVGAPGSGKTTATRALARELATQALHQITQGADLREMTLPLWVRLSSVRFDANAPVDALLVAAQVPDALQAFYRQMLENGRVVLFLDGLDEVDEQHEMAFKAWLRALHTALPHAPLLITCRTLPWESGRAQWAADLKAGEPYELAPLNAREQEAFVRKFFADKPKTMSALLSLMRQNFALRHTGRTYLRMTMLCLLHAQGKVSANTTYAELYEAFFLDSMRGRWKETGFDWATIPLGSKRDTIIRASLRRVLMPIGFQLQHNFGNKNDFKQEDWEEAFEQALEADQSLARSRAIDLSIALRLYDLLEQVGIISKQGQRFFFNHLSFLEFLAGAHLAEKANRASRRARKRAKRQGKSLAEIDREARAAARKQLEPDLKGTGEGERLYEGAEGTVHRAPQGSWLWFAPEYQEALAFMASAMDDATPLLEVIEAEEQRFPREVFRHLLVHKARVAGYGQVEPRKREAIVQEVVRLWIEGEHPPLRYVLPALRALGQYAVDALIECLQDGDAGVRRTAAWGLGELRAAWAVDALLQRLQDRTEDVRVRAAAAEALGQIRDARAVDALIQRLQDRIENVDVRRAAAWALGQIRDARAVDALLQRLQDRTENVDVRRASAVALGWIGDARAVDALIQRLQDRTEDVNVRVAAAWALRRIGNTLVVSRLIHLLQKAWDREWAYETLFAICREHHLIAQFPDDAPRTDAE